MNISYEGIGELVVTVPAGTCKEGQICKIGLQGKADICPANDKFCGLVLAVENGMAAVQVGGFVTVGFSGTKPLPGYVTLAGDGAGNVTQNSAGREYLVVYSSQETMTATIKL